MRNWAFIPFFAMLAFAPAAAADTTGICATTNAPVFDDTISGITSPCATAPGTVVAETTYIQNASRVGGTALATYPMITLRTGLTRNLAFDLDPPSEVAESGERGLGVYVPTHLGYGLSYTAAETSRMAVAMFTSLLPPVNRFAPSLVQPKYALGLTSAYALGSRYSLGFSGQETSSATHGFDRIQPSGALSADYDASADTQISTDVGTRVNGRRALAQSYGDVAVDKSLAKHFIFKVGLGTTFNPVANSKPHYLASGLDYRL
jgi:hypothetical protein